ncbi:MAG: ComEC/Rec2 family competence protein [Gammaproteobacteria bacterium]
MDILFCDVDHGACTLICSDNGHHFMIDCGHSSRRNWRPSEHLRCNGIHKVEYLFVSNFDEDHVSDLPNLIEYVPYCCYNTAVSADYIRKLKQPSGIGNGIKSLLGPMSVCTPEPFYNRPDWGGLIFSMYGNKPQLGLTDTNNLSLVTFVHYYNLHLIFPGDIEEIGWRELLKNPNFCNELKTVNVFVASHHGRASGYCTDVFEWCCPELVIYSDSKIQFDTQQTAANYGQHTRGITFPNGVIRKVLTTRNDGHISIQKYGMYRGSVTTEKG